MSMNRKRNVVVWGAGREGRGFLGHLFAGAVEVVFVDTDVTLVETLQKRGAYTLLQLPPNSPSFEEQVSGFKAVAAGQLETDAAVAEADCIALCIYTENMPEAAKAMLPGLLRRRAETPDRSLDILLCVNAIHFAPRLGEIFSRVLPAEMQEWFARTVGLAETLVRRTCVEPPAEVLARDPLAVATNVYPTIVVDAAAFRGDWSGFSFLEPTRDMRMEERRKIYTYNLVHAAYAYLGNAKGYQELLESRNDAAIQALAEEAYRRAAAALSAKYGLSPGEMEAYEKVMWRYVVNPAMPDSIRRTGFDPIRKLGRDERLIGPALMCLEQGIDPGAIVQVAAHAFAYDEKTDPGSRQLLAEVARDGIMAAIVRHCGLPADHVLVGRIGEAYRRITGT